MAATIRLTVVTGPHKGSRFCFRAPTQCTLGRGSDCFVRLAGERRDESISRHHCELNIHPPCFRITDLDSRNGTFVNGQNLKELERSLLDVLSPDGGTGINVDDGDIITVGGTSLRADLMECPPPQVANVWTDGETTKKDCPVNC